MLRVRNTVLYVRDGRVVTSSWKSLEITKNVRIYAGQKKNRGKGVKYVTFDGNHRHIQAFNK